MHDQPTRRGRNPPVPRSPDAHRSRHTRPRRDTRTGQRIAPRHQARCQLQRGRPLGRDARRRAARPHPLARRPRTRSLMSTLAIRISDLAHGPEVWLLDARGAGLDEPGLRNSARAVTDAAAARHTARCYRYPYALVSWHTGRVGIDIERIEPCDPAFAASISTPAETVEWASLTDPYAYFSSIWSSKEALAKALGNPLSYDPRRLEAPMRWPAGQAGPWRAAQLPVRGDHVAWICWRSADQPADSPAMRGRACCCPV